MEGHGKIWWSLELSALRKEVRRLNNNSYRSKCETDRKVFKDAAEKDNKKELELAGSRNWQKYCSEIDSLSETARLCRVLRNGAPRQEGPLKTVADEWAEDVPAVLDGLIEGHFPDAHTEALRATSAPWAMGCGWTKAKKIAPFEWLRWVTSTLPGIIAKRHESACARRKISC